MHLIRSEESQIRALKAHEELTGILFLPVRPWDRRTWQLCSPKNMYENTPLTPKLQSIIPLGRRRNEDFKAVREKRGETRQRCGGLAGWRPELVTVDPVGSVLPEAWTRRWAAPLGAVTSVTKTLHVEISCAVLQAHCGSASQTHEHNPWSRTGGGPK